MANRRLVLWPLAAIGAFGAVAFGVLVIKLQMGAPLVILGLGGMTLAFFGIAAYRVLEPVIRKEGVKVEDARRPERLRDLEREKQAAIKAIKEIELDFQMRKISEVDHREMTQRYRARALRLLAELEIGDDVRALIEQELRLRLAAQKALEKAGGAPGSEGGTP